MTDNNKNESFVQENDNQRKYVESHSAHNNSISTNTVIIVVCVSICIIAVAIALVLILGNNSNNSGNNDTNSGLGNDDVGNNNVCIHSWIAATCTTPKKCSICNEIEGSVAEHTWMNATCTTAQTCSKCGETMGAALGHSWEEATCTEPKHCSICNDTQGAIGDHYDNGKGICKYCNQDILLLEMQEGFDVRLIIPTVGGMNAYCTVKYSNNTKHAISSDMTFLSANGKVLYNSEAIFTLQPNYYATATYYRSILPSDRYNSKHYDLYLDNNSLAYTNVTVDGKTIFVRFGANGPVAFGYSLADIGVY